MDEVEIVPRIPNFLESDQTGQEEDVAERVTTVPVATGVVESTIPGEAKVDDEDNENEFTQIIMHPLRPTRSQYKSWQHDKFYISCHILKY